DRRLRQFEARLALRNTSVGGYPTRQYPLLADSRLPVMPGTVLSGSRSMRDEQYRRRPRSDPDGPPQLVARQRAVGYSLDEVLLPGGAELPHVQLQLASLFRYRRKGPALGVLQRVGHDHGSAGCA